MTTINPQYNPNWEIIHDYHHEHRSRIENDLSTRVGNMTLDLCGKEYKELNAQRAFHHETCLRCLDTHQHKTIQNYYKWRTQNLDLEHPALNENNFTLPDPEEFKTMDQARETATKISQITEVC